MNQLNGTILSQQGVWVSFGHPNPQKSPPIHPNFQGAVLFNAIFKRIFELIHPDINAMTLYIRFIAFSDERGNLHLSQVLEDGSFEQISVITPKKFIFK